jgi:hypothetical protein
VGPEDDGADPDEPFGHLPQPGPGDETGDETGGADDATPPPRIPHRYRGSMAAGALAAGMIGLRDVLEEPKDGRPVVEQFADEGDRERPIEVDLVPDAPAASTVTVRHQPED